MNKIKVVGYKIMFHPRFKYPVLRCTLEDGRFFDMSSIPVDAAIAIERLANGVDITSDPRMILALFLAEIPFIEHALRDTVREVVIDDVLEYRGGYVYCATVKVSINGKTFKRIMVPSSAIILALLAGAEVYVDERFLVPLSSSEKL